MDYKNADKELKAIRKREARCAKTFQGRALLVFNHILTGFESEDKLLSKLYRIAHCATGTCGNPHEDWVKEVEDTYTQISGSQR